MQLYVFVSNLNMFVFQKVWCPLFFIVVVYGTSEGEVWSCPHGKERQHLKKRKGKPLELIMWGLWGGGKEKEKYLALVRNGGLNHLLKIFNDISVFLV